MPIPSQLRIPEHPDPSNSSTVMSTALLRLLLIRDSAIGSHSLMILLDRLSVIWLNPTSCTQGQMAQWLEHPVYIWEVLGSNPSLVIFLIAPTCRPSKGGPSYGFPLLRSLWVAFLTASHPKNTVQKWSNVACSGIL